jgi:hypothetical protein
MKTAFFTLAFAAALITFGAGTTHASTDCEDGLSNGTKFDLELPFIQFDQTAGQGWRALSEKLCFAQAAELLRRYRNANPDSHIVLAWHQSQMEAAAGNVSSAVSLAKATLRPTELELKSGFHWNPYALGFVAFMERDKRVLERNVAKLREVVATEPKNALNLASLRRLLACFDLPYQAASACPE